jgi:hypothetical protein
MLTLASMNEGTFRYSEPNTRNNICSTTSATASEIISTASCEARIGRMNTRSTTTPNAATPATVTIAASHSGRWAIEVSA